MPKMDVKEQIRRSSYPTVVRGDIAQMSVDAIVVPHFYNQNNWGGVIVSRAAPIDEVKDFISEDFGVGL